MRPEEVSLYQSQTVGQITKKIMKAEPTHFYAVDLVPGAPKPNAQTRYDISTLPQSNYWNLNIFGQEHRCLHYEMSTKLNPTTGRQHQCSSRCVRKLPVTGGKVMLLPATPLSPTSTTG